MLNKLKDLYRGYRNLDTVDYQRNSIFRMKSELDSIYADFMGLVYDLHGKEGTKLDLAMHRKIQDELDNAEGDGLLDITTPVGTIRHSDDRIAWCPMTDYWKVVYYKASYVVPPTEEEKL